MNCKHGIELEWCALCNGSKDKEEMKLRKFKEMKVARSRFIAKRKELQELSKEFATNHGTKFTEDELKKIVVNTVDIEKDDLNAIFGLAKDMKRTMYSIDWMVFSLWDDRFIEMCERRNVSDIERLERLMDIKEEVLSVV